MSECYLHRNNDPTQQCQMCGAHVCDGCTVTFNGKILCPDCMRREILNENYKLITARIALYSEIKRLCLLFLIGVAALVAITLYNREWILAGILIMLILPNYLIFYKVVSWMWQVMGLGRDIRRLFVDVTTYNIRDMNGYVMYHVDGSRRLKGERGESTGLFIDKDNHIRDTCDRVVARILPDNDVEDNFNRIIGHMGDETTYRHQLSTVNLVGLISKMLVFIVIASFVLELSPIILIIRLIRRKMDLNKYNKILLANDKVLWDIRIYCEDPTSWTLNDSPWSTYASHTEDIEKIERRAV